MKETCRSCHLTNDCSMVEMNVLSLHIVAWGRVYANKLIAARLRYNLSYLQLDVVFVLNLPLSMILSIFMEHTNGLSGTGHVLSCRSFLVFSAFAHSGNTNHHHHQDLRIGSLFCPRSRQISLGHPMWPPVCQGVAKSP